MKKKKLSCDRVAVRTARAIYLPATIYLSVPSSQSLTAFCFFPSDILLRISFAPRLSRSVRANANYYLPLYHSLSVNSGRAVTINSANDFFLHCERCATVQRSPCSINEVKHDKIVLTTMSFHAYGYDFPIRVTERRTKIRLHKCIHSHVVRIH